MARTLHLPFNGKSHLWHYIGRVLYRDDSKEKMLNTYTSTRELCVCVCACVKELAGR